MKYRKTGLLIMALVFCLAMTQMAGANVVLKNVYVDGAKVTQGSAGPEELSYIFNRLTIGCEGSIWYRYNGFKGQMDDFAVYNGVLSDARIAAHYGAASSAAYVTAVGTDNPLLYLQLQDASVANGATAANTGTDPNVKGTYYGAITRVANRFGNATSAINLAGTTGGGGDCIDVADANGDLSLSGITVELWVRLDVNVAGAYPRFFQHNNGDAKMGSYGGVYVTDSCGVGTIGGGNTGYMTRNIQDDGWHHVVMTYSPIIVAAGKAYNLEVMQDNPILYMRFEGETHMEEIENNWYYYYDYNGNIAEFNIFTSLAYGDPGEQTRTECRPAGGIGESIFLNSWPLYHSGPPAGWGTDGHVCAATASGSGGTFKPKYELVNPDVNYAFVTGDVTYEFWIKRAAVDDVKWPWPNRRYMAADDPAKTLPAREPEPNVFDTNTYAYIATIFTQADTNSNTGAPRMQFVEGDVDSLDNAEGNIRIGVGVPVAGVNQWYPGIQIPGTDKQWHQLVLVYDVNGSGDYINPAPGDNYNSMNVYLYKDGVLAASLYAVDPCGLGNAKLGPWLCTFLVGCSGSWGYGFNGFGGYFDEIAIYPGQLSADRILAHYAAWQPRTCSESIVRGYGMTADLDQDCDVDFVDFAELALNWARCNLPGGTNCVKNW